MNIFIFHMEYGRKIKSGPFKENWKILPTVLVVFFLKGKGAD